MVLCRQSEAQNLGEIRIGPIERIRCITDQSFRKISAGVEGMSDEVKDLTDIRLKLMGRHSGAPLSRVKGGDLGTPDSVVKPFFYETKMKLIGIQAAMMMLFTCCQSATTSRFSGRPGSATRTRSGSSVW